MSDDPQERAVLAEERALQGAQRAGDVAELDRLLHPELLAVGPDGQMVDKDADLGAHRSGVFKIRELEEDELRVKVLGDVALTFVVLRIRGSIAEAEVAGRCATRAHGRATAVPGAFSAPISAQPAPRAPR